MYELVCIHLPEQPFFANLFAQIGTNIMNYEKQISIKDKFNNFSIITKLFLYKPMHI